MHIVVLHHRLVETLALCRDRAAAHACRINAHDAPRNQPSKWLLSTLLSLTQWHDDNSRAAIYDSRSIARGHTAILAKRRFQFLKTFHRRLRTQVIIALE